MQHSNTRFAYITNYMMGFHYHGKLIKKQTLAMQESLWHMHTGRNLKMLIDGTYVAIAS